MFVIYIRHLHSTFTFDVYIFWLYMRSPTIITLLPGLQEKFSKFRSTSKSVHDFGALRVNPCIILDGYFETPQGSGAAKSEPVGGGRREEEGGHGGEKSNNPIR